MMMAALPNVFTTVSLLFISGFLPTILIPSIKAISIPFGGGLPVGGGGLPVNIPSASKYIPIRLPKEFLEIRCPDSSKDKPIEGKSSLAFVIDITHSMLDDLYHVRNGTKRIFNIFTKQKKNFISDFLLVPYYDINVAPVTATKDTDCYQRKINSLEIGTGDANTLQASRCPEYCLHGIKDALENAQPSSFIYVFTDATAIDFDITKQVLNLIQEKQSEVVFVMTGDCSVNRTKDESYLAYEKIATSSGGLIFHVEKDNLTKVLKYVELSVKKTRKIPVLTLDRPNGRSSEVEVPIDAGLDDITLLISGNKTKLSLKTKKGKAINKKNGLKKILSLENVVAINLEKPPRGVLKVKISAKSKHSLRVFGSSKIQLKYGFSARKSASNLKKASPRPIIGAKTFILVQLKGLPKRGKAQTLQLISPEGKVLYKSKLTKSRGAAGVYYAGPTVPPKGFCFIKVTGIDGKKLVFQRYSSIAVSAKRKPRRG